jgi:Gnt-I system high-affinity gluconate transporter
MGTTLLYGTLISVPTLLIAGPLFARSLKSISTGSLELFKPTTLAADQLPGTFNSFACALLPVVLISGATVLSYGSFDSSTRTLIDFLGNPMLVMLVSLFVGSITLGVARGRKLGHLMDGYGHAVRDIAGILLIIGGAGALKQVFVDSGVNTELGSLLGSVPIHPLVLGWLVAFAIRIALGSATVAGLTAAGIVAPLIEISGVDANLMVLAVGAGSLMCSHVNDSAFWMFKEYFQVSLRDTFRSWTLMETLVGSLGLIFVLLLNAAL